MNDPLEIRESTQRDLPSIEALYPDAFPDEDLLPVVKPLLDDGPVLSSLVAIADETVVGHVLFTPCSVGENATPVALLAPLGVVQARQRQGIGSALVRTGLQRLEQSGIGTVCVLGDPAYYGRLGFEPEADIEPPYPLPAAWRGAWQSLRLRNSGPTLKGKLSVPHPWRQPALWGP